MTTVTTSYFRPSVDRLRAYEPGEQPRPDAPVVKLNTNENPYPPSPRAMAVLHELAADHLRRYPHPFAIEFQEAVADVLDVDPERVLVGNGSDDLLTIIMRAVTEPARGVAFPVPTYVLYRTLAEIQGAPVREVPFDEAFALPLEGLVQAETALTIVANPNSPSGTMTPIDILAELATRTAGLVVIDEAYVEFADDHALSLTSRFENVVVLRTLSKSHALAGLRLGYAVGPAPVIRGLAKVKDSYNVGAVPSRVGAAALRDTAYTASTVQQIRVTRERLTEELRELGFRVWPSHANFLLVRPPTGRADALYRCLKTEGVLVRYFDAPGLTDKLRVTVGTNAEVDRFCHVVRDWLDQCRA